MVKLSERIRAFLQLTTPAVWVLLVLAVGASAFVITRQRHGHDGGVLWTFSRPHSPGYVPVLADWNREHPDKPYELLLLDYHALENRMLSGFLSGTPIADLMEVERNIAARAFTGPLPDVGFVDLTDRLKAEGLLDKINAPSFSPWTSRGRIFGLPHDVHPVLLAYRSDIVEAAGIDLSKADTWPKFFAAMRPLMTDNDGDGRPDRYIINFWPNNTIAIELLLLQAGGSFFDADERRCEEDQSEEGASAETGPVEQQGEPEGERKLQEDRSAGEERGIAQRLPEQRVVQEEIEVGEADPGRRLRPVGLLKSEQH
jgi:arabinosaccharide transport system substrate-binding protein